MKAVLLVIASLLLAFGAEAQTPEKVRLMIIVTGTERPLQVNLISQSDANKAAVIGGLVGLFVSEGIKRNVALKLAGTLNETIPAFDRKASIEKAIQSHFASKYPVFEIVFAEDASRFMDAKKIYYDQLKTDGFPFFLVVDDLYTGLRAPNGFFTKNDWVVPAVGLQYRLYDADAKKSIAKNSAEGSGLERKPMGEALKDREFFLSKYSVVLDAAVAAIVGQMYRTDKLNLMATRSGLGDKVPAAGKLLAKYEKQFEYSFGMPKGWKADKSKSKYILHTGPRDKDRSKVGVSYSIDLLVPEFGQAVPTLDDYFGVFVGRLEELGYKTETIKDFTDLPTTKEYKTVILDRPDGVGKEILLLRMVDPTFVEIFSVIFIDDYDKYYAQYRPDILSAINNTSLKIFKAK